MATLQQTKRRQAVQLGPHSPTNREPKPARNRVQANDVARWQTAELVTLLTQNPHRVAEMWYRSQIDCTETEELHASHSDSECCGALSGVHQAMHAEIDNVIRLLREHFYSLWSPRRPSAMRTLRHCPGGSRIESSARLASEYFKGVKHEPGVQACDLGGKPGASASFRSTTRSRRRQCVIKRPH